MWDSHIVFVFILCDDYADRLLCMKTSISPRDKPHLIMVQDLFNVLLDLVCNVCQGSLPQHPSGNSSQSLLGSILFCLCYEGEDSWDEFGKVLSSSIFWKVSERLLKSSFPCSMEQMPDFGFCFGLFRFCISAWVRLAGLSASRNVLIILERSICGDTTLLWPFLTLCPQLYCLDFHFWWLCFNFTQIFPSFLLSLAKSLSILYFQNYPGFCYTIWPAYFCLFTQDWNQGLKEVCQRHKAMEASIADE